MDGIDFLLFPFTLIYRGFITVLLLPYYFVVGVAKVFSNNKATMSKENKTVAELKKGENIKVIKNVRSAYEKPNVPEKETDENKIKQKKFENNIKKQKEFERLVAKARKEEAKRIKEGYIAVVGNKIGATYKGKPTEAILEIIKQRITAEVFYSYAYIVDAKDINTKIWEFNKEMNNAHPKLKALLNSFDKIHGEGRENGNKSN